jgi:hypothetical protein
MANLLPARYLGTIEDGDNTGAGLDHDGVKLKLILMTPVADA